MGSELENPGWELVFGGEGGGVVVDDGLVLALVEGVVDVEEFWEIYQEDLCMLEHLLWHLPPSAENGSIVTAGAIGWM